MGIHKNKTRIKQKRLIDREKLIINALCDPNGLGKLELMLHNVYVPHYYHYIFHQLPFHIQKAQEKKEKSALH